jgi:hypothetical protein
VSSTNRGSTVRREADFYPTPEVTTRALLEVLDLPDGLWFEPAVGAGAIVRAVERHRPNRQTWIAGDIRPIPTPPYVEGKDLFIGDFLSLGFDQALLRRLAVIITNPPFCHALPFARKCLDLAAGRAWVVLLLRLAFLETEERAGFLRAYPPDVYPLAKRPSFNGDGTDSAAYAWFVWPPISGRKHGILYPPIGLHVGQTSLLEVA